MTEPSLKLPNDPDPDVTDSRSGGDREPPFSLAALIKLGIATLAVIGASFAGQIATMRGLDPWYFSLAKPAFNPPPSVFPIVWTLLYALMAWVLWRLLRLRPDRDGRGPALALFAVQLALNVLWSWAFFGARNPLAGVFVILALDIAIWAMIAALRRVDRSAALSQIPYALWVGFATILNGAIWTLN